MNGRAAAAQADPVGLGTATADDWIGSRAAVVLALAGVTATAVGLVALDSRTATELGAVLVAMIYGVYSGFALANGSPRHLALETAFVATGLTLALLSLHHGRVWLAAALALHGIWDLLHHANRQLLGTPGVPRWYVPFCTTYDVLAAALVFALL